MVQLVIDRGNSVCKWAFFEAAPTGSSSTGGSLAERYRACQPLEVLLTPSAELPDLSFLRSRHPVNCIYSSVGKPDPQLLDSLRSTIPFVMNYTIDTPVPIGNAYHTPKTLGPDRLAAAVGAWTLSPGSASLIVDMGTAVTYDLLTADGVYQGGNIAPGIWLRFKSLYENTAALPMVEAKADFPAMGTDTETAIRAGVMQGIWNELESYQRYYASRNQGLQTFLTGGDLIYFDKKIKNGIFVAENLVLIGLHRILSENAPV